MSHFICGEDRHQATLFPELLDDYIDEDSTVRLLDAYIDQLDLAKLGFDRVIPSLTGRPAYSPATLDVLAISLKVVKSLRAVTNMCIHC